MIARAVISKILKYPKGFSPYWNVRLHTAAGIQILIVINLTSTFFRLNNLTRSELLHNYRATFCKLWSCLSTTCTNISFPWDLKLKKKSMCSVSPNCITSLLVLMFISTSLLCPCRQTPWLHLFPRYTFNQSVKKDQGSQQGKKTWMSCPKSLSNWSNLARRRQRSHLQHYSWQSKYMWEVTS